MHQNLFGSSQTLGSGRWLKRKEVPVDGTEDERKTAEDTEMGGEYGTVGGRREKKEHSPHLRMSSGYAPAHNRFYAS